VVVYGLQDIPIQFPKFKNEFAKMEDNCAQPTCPRFLSDGRSAHALVLILTVHACASTARRAEMDSFTLKPARMTYGPSEQRRIVEDCNELRSNTRIVADGEAYCILNELQRYAGAAFPYPDEASLVVALRGFYASSYYRELETNYTQYGEYTGFVQSADGSDLLYLYNAFNTTTPTRLAQDPSLIATYHDPWKAAVDARCKAGAGSVSCVMTNFGPPGAVRSGGIFYWMGTLRELGLQAILNILQALAVSYAVLVCVTQNWIVPFFAITSTGATITMVLAVIFSMGFKFDANAAILIVVAVGLSVDYAVHLAHFYNEQPGKRKEKSQMALHGVGLSVWGGALTTGGAAVPLCFAKHFLFFEEAGFFILLVAVFGLFFSLCMLMPLLMICGPEGTTGDLANYLGPCVRCVKKVLGMGDGARAATRNSGKGIDMKTTDKMAANVA
jgi:hypothetical protein